MQRASLIGLLAIPGLMLAVVLNSARGDVPLCAVGSLPDYTHRATISVPGGLRTVIYDQMGYPLGVIAWDYEGGWETGWWLTTVSQVTETELQQRIKQWHESLWDYPR